MRTPIADSCPGCGYILNPKTGTCLLCGYGQDLPRPEADNENWWQDQGI